MNANELAHALQAIPSEPAPLLLVIRTPNLTTVTRENVRTAVKAAFTTAGKTPPPIIAIPPGFDVETVTGPAALYPNPDDEFAAACLAWKDRCIFCGKSTDFLGFAEGICVPCADRFQTSDKPALIARLAKATKMVCVLEKAHQLRPKTASADAPTIVSPASS
jgi:hypothetical protein